MRIISSNKGRVSLDVYALQGDALAGVVSFNDPDRLNAMTQAMADDFMATTGLVEAVQPAAIIVTGKGRAFSAGGDLEMLRQKQQQPVARNQMEMLFFYYSFLRLLQLDIPTIAAINGPAIGAGMCFGCACDIRIAAESEKSILGFSFSKLGLTPGMGGTLFLPRLVGQERARELFETARNVTPREALAMGMVDEVVEPDHLLSRALEIAQEIAIQPDKQTELLSKRLDHQQFLSGLTKEAMEQGASFLSHEHLTRFPAFLASLRSSRS